MFHKNFKAIRKTRGLSQKDIAEHLHITVQAISKWESGEVLPSTQYLPTLAKLLKCSIDDFFTEEMQPKFNVEAETIRRFLTVEKDLRQGRIDEEQWTKATKSIPFYCEQTIPFLHWLEAYPAISRKELSSYFKCSDEILAEIIEHLIDCEIISWGCSNDLFIIENAHSELVSLMQHYILEHKEWFSPEQLFDILTSVE